MTGEARMHATNGAAKLIGRRFGRLVVIAVAPSITNHSRVECVCDCGAERVFVESRKLTQGHNKSCGCMRAGLSITKEHLRRGAEMCRRRMAERAALRPPRKPAEVERSTRAPGWGPKGREAARDLADALGYTYRSPSGGQRKATMTHRLRDDLCDAMEAGA